ncbi:MAG TPA: alpha/beta fold hydrolase [Burkholderiales bacterium]
MPAPISSLPLQLIHGLLSTPQEFDLIGNALRRSDVQHQAISVPGYTQAHRAVDHDWRAWRDAAVQAIRERTPAGPLVLGGLCMGGVLAAAAALELGERVAGLVLISPTFTYDGWGLPRLCRLRSLSYWTGLDRFISIRERHPYGIKNPKIRKWVEYELQQRAQSPVGPARISLRALREGERMMRHVRQRLGRLDCPLLVMHAREDEITRLESVQALFDGLPARDKQFAVLENSYHMVTIDNDRHEVAAQLARFVARMADPSPGPAAASSTAEASAAPIPSTV